MYIVHTYLHLILNSQFTALLLTKKPICLGQDAASMWMSISSIYGGFVEPRNILWLLSFLPDIPWCSKARLRPILSCRLHLSPSGYLARRWHATSPWKIQFFKASRDVLPILARKEEMICWLYQIPDRWHIC